VQQGIYPGPIELIDGVAMIGGFNGLETSVSQADPYAFETIIDGGGVTRCVVSINTGPSTILRGFVLQNGSDASFDGGGGMLIYESKMSVVQCTFRENFAAWWGAAVSTGITQYTGLTTNSPSFVNCVFHDNGEKFLDLWVGTIAGGAVFFEYGWPTFSNCLFVGNLAGEGAAIAMDLWCRVTLVNCSLIDNHANVGSAGGLHDQEGQAVLRNCVMWGNSAVRGGDQIYNDPSRRSDVKYSAIEGGFPGEGNIDIDPTLSPRGGSGVTASLNDAGLLSALPLDFLDLDTDGDVGEPLPFDLSMRPRIVGDSVDLGVLEAPTKLDALDFAPHSAPFRITKQRSTVDQDRMPLRRP
jgi:hypothetical protein